MPRNKPVPRLALPLSPLLAFSLSPCLRGEKPLQENNPFLGCILARWGAGFLHPRPVAISRYCLDGSRARAYNPSMAEPNENPANRQRRPETIREFEDRSAQWLFEDPENVRGLLQIQDPALAEC